MTRFRMPSRRRTGPVALAAAALLMTAGLAPTADAAGSSGAAYAWGYNNVGQAGNPAAAAYYFAVPVSDLFKDVVIVAAGDTHSLALLADGTVWAWGANNHGQLGVNWATSAIAIDPGRSHGAAGQGGGHLGRNPAQPGLARRRHGLGLGFRPARGTRQ